MIFAEATPFGAGLTLWGDYHDLRSLYDTVGKAVNVAPGNIGDFIVGLNYDIRHAYEGQRVEKRFGNDEMDSVTYRGERILWPTIILQTRLVRGYLAFAPTTREDQANIYRLEFAVGQALRNYDAEIGEICAETLDQSELLTSKYLMGFVEEATYKYVSEGRAGKQRFRKLPSTLRTLSSLSAEYRAYEAELKSIAAEKQCEPGDLHTELPWEDFKW